MIRILVLATVGPGFWMQPAADPAAIAPETLPFVIANMDDINRPELQAARRKGTKLYARIVPFYVPPSLRTKFPVSAYNQTQNSTFQPDRTSHLDCLSPEGQAAAEEIVEGIKSWPVDGVILVMRMPTDAPRTYSIAARTRVIEKFGLDPVDFANPFYAPEFDGRPQLPDAVIESEVRATSAAWLRMAQRVAKVTRESKKSFSLLADLSLDSLTPAFSRQGFRYGLQGRWQDAVTLPGLERIWVSTRATPAFLAEIGAIAPKIGKGIYGRPETFDRAAMQLGGGSILTALE